MNTALKKISDKVIELKYPEGVDTFWSEEFISNKGKVYSISGPQLKRWVIKQGYYNYEGSLIRLVGNVAQKSTPEEVFNAAMAYVESFEDETLTSVFMKQGESMLLKNKAILISLPECEVPHLRDTKKKSFHFFSNGIVEVQGAKEFKLLPYDKAAGFVWGNEIKEREFEIFGEDDFEKAMFCKFVQNITNDEQHFLSLCSAMGYLMHRYKDERLPVCIIINDENLIDEGKPEGGTGKGIVVKAISYEVPKAMYNGKNSDFTNNKFVFQNVNETSAILVVDDASRNFDFEALFSVLTDDMPVERKHQDIKIIPYERSPKFVITTNYTIKGNSSSYKRRRFDTFLTNYYSSERTPADDFGCEFFHGWNAEEWKRFDFFMMGCLRIYLSEGLIRYENESLRLKMLKNETAPEFYALMEEEFNTVNKRFYYTDLVDRMLDAGGENFGFLKGRKNTMTQWVKLYSEFKGLPMNHERGNRGYYFEFLNHPGENTTGKKVDDVEF